MSVESLTIALHHSRATGTARLVLLGIANHDGDGGAWPALATLAKYANVHPRNVRKAIRKLEELGEVVTTVQGGGLADHDDYTRPNLYTFRLRCPVTCDGSRHHRTKRGPAFEQPLAPVDNPTTDPRALPPGEGASARGGGGASAPLTVHRTEPNPVPASTTDRARESSPPAAPPTEELARIREQLRQDTIRTTSREHRQP